MIRRWRDIATPMAVLDATVVLSVIFVTIWSLHPSLLVSSNLITGGDTGAHVALPAYLRGQGGLFNLTPWYPGWFAGMPAYTYYFVLPDILATLASYVINFAVAFKLATVLGSVLMPICAYVMGRLFRAPRPIPAALAMATLPFLFDATFTIDGGNLFSTMAGEYAFSLSLALALLTIGLFARGMRTGRGYWLAAVALSATLASHVLPWLFSIGAVGVLLIFELLARRGIGDPRDPVVAGDYSRPFRFALGTGILSGLLSAWWLLPFVTTQSLTNSMGYTNDNVSTLRAIFSILGWYNSNGAAAGDRWVIVMAGLALVTAFLVRDRLGMFLTSMVVLSLVAFVFDPQSVIWNERLVPFWFIMIHLSAGWLLGYPLARWINASRLRRGASESHVQEIEPVGDEVLVSAAADTGIEETFVGPEWTSDVAEAWPPGDESDVELDDELRRARRTVRSTMAVALLGLATVVPGLVAPAASALGLHTSGNQVSGWAQWNYSGYQAKPAWPEYHDVITTMERVAGHYGCGRAMWEYNSSQNRFGTPMAMMLLPYWTNNCIDSMEGLFFESSATTPYHFLDQAELSAAPSNPQVGLPYGPLDVSLGVEHLQMLGVRYFIAFSPSVISQANADPSLRFVAQTRAWPSPGVRWRVYLIKDSPLVEPLVTMPNVVSGLTSRVGWLNANTTWWLDPRMWRTVAASSGPATWPRAGSISTMNSSITLPTTKVSALHVGTQSVSFHVSRLGVPVLVKISYFPSWRATGATGPYRVSPNLMVVVPTAHDVSLEYSNTPALSLASLLTNGTVLVGVVVLLLTWRKRRNARQ
ncbi:MAG: hypothetical protein HKL86_03870 [Acidimicrobiaceae bacterium]|nr:hypothetical protein [Acidimicrobiaceae bacterium]